jgi:ethanolamine utilization cobalamin adenosyltransferase
MTITELLIAELDIKKLISLLPNYMTEEKIDMIIETIEVNQLNEEEAKRLITELL